MRLAYYAGASTAAAAACLLKAFHQRPNFYSATVYLSQSNACLLILTNLLLILSCGFLYGLQRVLYGRLRPIEIEQLSEKAWYAVLDTLLAMPSFREDVGGQLLVMFVLLLAGKVWGWIGEGRVDVLEQGQMPTSGNGARLFHGRLATSLVVSVLFSFGMLKYCVDAVVEDPRPGMMVIFTFEFAVQCVFSTFTLARYALSVVEMGIVKKQTALAIEARKSEIKVEREAARALAIQEGREEPADEGEIDVDENEVDVPGWEEKRRWLFALEVFTDFIKLVIYIVFFTVSITFNGLPMHIMRDVYMTFASFSKRVSDYVAYRKATTEMNTRYPDATTEEIRGDSCIVCREEMVAWAEGEPQTAPPPQQAAEPNPQQPAVAAPPAIPAPAAAQNAAPTRRRDEGLRAKKLPCGHILHLRCLKAWLERQQVCPTCRRPVVTATLPAVNGAAGANPPPPGQPGQHPAPQRPRGRIFNLGPIRIGLVNAPQGQVQNILNQIQQPGAAANQAQVAPPQQPQGTGTGTGQARGHPAGGISQLPIHIQLMHREQRLMREAHNLGLDQRALANLRAMEAELARLRALRVPEQVPVGITPQRIVPQPMPLPQVGMGLPNPFLQPVPPTIVDQLSGNSTQQLASGSEGLPEGLVLPEGWTLMPLQRSGAQQSSSDEPVLSSVASTQQQDATQESSTSEAQAPNSTSPTLRAMQAAFANAAPADQSGTSPQGPTDETGSPLFVPSDPLPATTESAPTLPQTTLPSSETVAEQEQPPSEQPSTSQPTFQPPWAGDSWSFGDQPEQPTQPSAPSNGHRPEHSEEHTGQNGSYTGKGKGRAVEVEEVPDPGQ